MASSFSWPGQVQLIWLKERATDLRDEACQSAQDQNKASLSALTKTEQDQLMEFMRRIIGSMRTG